MPKDTDTTAAAEKNTTKKTAEKTTKKATATSKRKTVKKVAKKAAKKTTTTTQRLRVRQVRSGNRHPWRMRRTLTALGLKHHQDEVVVPDNPSIRGMLQRVHHLISVTPEDTNG